MCQNKVPHSEVRGGAKSAKSPKILTIRRNRGDTHTKRHQRGGCHCTVHILPSCCPYAFANPSRFNHMPYRCLTKCWWRRRKRRQGGRWRRAEVGRRQVHLFLATAATIHHGAIHILPSCCLSAFADPSCLNHTP